MTEDKPQDKSPDQDAAGQGAAPPASGEMSREEKIAAAKAKAEAIKAQRAAEGGAPARATAPAAKPAAPATPALATSDNPGGQPVQAPQNPKIEAFGTITQSVELRCESTEDQNLRKLLGGIGAYRNPLRNVWQIDYRYFAEARKRLAAAGYQLEGKDYLGRPLEQWTPSRGGWTRLAPS